MHVCMCECDKIFFVPSSCNVASDKLLLGNATHLPFILQSVQQYPMHQRDLKPTVRASKKINHTGIRSIKQKKTIVLDPGHGGVYWGQIGSRGNLIEKEIVLTLAKAIATKLRARGYRVILTRTSDVEFDKTNLLNDLASRAKFTRTYKADILVSLHLNGSKNTMIRGYEIYVPYESTFPARSYKLATSLHYELSHKIKPIFGGGALGNLNNLDHGISASKFNVLTKAQCAAVVVELDYLTNATSERMLSKPSYQTILVNAVYYGIRRYFEG